MTYLKWFWSEIRTYLKSLFSIKGLIQLSLFLARLVPQPTGVVHVTGGLVRGYVAPDGSHLRYLGIPYAIVTHRFQLSKPHPKWEGIHNAYNEHIRCKQRFSVKRVLGEEDCLTVNVYTPLQKTDQSLPVMVFIHGGGFRDGSGSPFIYGPKYFVEHGVILVTFNYRLEVLGFLCLGIKEAPGNVGLKDQVEALKWVKRNILSFGGDPDNITLFGESAGAASVVYHLVSPMSGGLFNRAIIQSGSAISPWSLQFKPLITASLLAQQMGYNTQNPHEIYNLFKNLPAETLLMTRVPRNEGDIVLSENIFVPCIEKQIPGEKQFLHDSPYNLISKGHYNKVPVIIGFNSAEGYMFTGKENDTTLSKIDFYKAMPRDLIIPSEDEKVKIAKRLDELYMGGEKITKENTSLEKISKFEGDTSITYPTVATIDLFLKTLKNPVYAYMFDYDGLLNLAKLTFGFRKSPGATHADELFYMFSLNIPLYVESEIIDRMTTLWTNFAKYGDPTPPSSSILPKWDKAEAKDPRLLVIGQECSMAPVWDDEALRFWNITYSKYRRKN